MTHMAVGRISASSWSLSPSVRRVPGFNGFGEGSKEIDEDSIRRVLNGGGNVRSFGRLFVGGPWGMF